MLSAFTVAAAAVALRFGGRAALLSLLGVDMMSSEGSSVKNALDGAMAYFDQLHELKYGAFFLGWVACKVLCLDFLAVGLALSSGIIFGGVVQGALLSTACATLASCISFQLARSWLKEPVKGQLAKRPALRAVERAVTDEGFKAVLTLRLAPVVPIPIGAYNYVYGATDLEFNQFVAGTFLGSLKPYAVDSYLGVFGKSIVDGSGGDSQDALLLAGFGIVILVGAFASQLAGSTYDQLKAEVGTAGEQWDWMSAWGIDKEKLPRPVKDWQARIKSAEDLCWGVVEQERGLQVVEAEDKQELPPPCPPPLSKKGMPDYSQYLAESWVFTFILWRAFTTFADPDLDI
ncbi:unnamed protein product [Chrysoparadoxa australica]